MKKAKIEINMDNAAFDYPYFETELKRILIDLSERVEYMTEQNGLAIRDINGNVVGEMLIEKD